jgi:hypothetical protein
MVSEIREVIVAVSAVARQIKPLLTVHIEADLTKITAIARLALPHSFLT